MHHTRTRVICGECKILHFVLRETESVACRRCQGVLAVPALEPPFDPDTDPALHASYYLFSNKQSPGSPLEIQDREEHPILFVDQPGSFEPGAVTMFFQVVVFILLFGVVLHFAFRADHVITGITLGVVGFLLAWWIGGAIVQALAPEKRVCLYADPDRRNPLVEVIAQQSQFAFRTPDGLPLGRLAKEGRGFFRKKWICRDAWGKVVAMALEDSMTLSLTRRGLGMAAGFLGGKPMKLARRVAGSRVSVFPASFDLLAADGKTILGHLGCGLTTLKPYVLELKGDQHPDQRLLLALAVVLAIEERGS
jgi:hypothetical protein